MLLDFTVKNFLSFDDKVTLAMEASAIKEKSEVVFLTDSFQWDYKLLRSVALFGFNSSGKSNLLKAIGLMKYGVLYSAALPNNVFKDNVQPYLLKEENAEKPSHFEIVFFRGRNKYRYGFEILKGAIHAEWLFQAEPKIREYNLFTRQGGVIVFSKKWNKDTDGMVETMVKRVKSNNQILFLSFLGILDVEPAADILAWFKKINIIESFNNEKFANYTAELLNTETYRYNILTMMRQAKLGFETVKEVKIGDGEKGDDRFSQDFISFMIDNEIIPKGKYDIFTQHYVYNDKGERSRSIDFNLLTQESTGTKKFFALVGLLLDAVINQKILLFDEIDSQLHSMLYETILNFFNKPSINLKGAQLIYTSHNTHLMKGKKLRRDQIYLMNKNDKGISTLERLHGTGRNIRTDATIEKDYLNNEYKNFPDIDFDIFTGELNFPDA